MRPVVILALAALGGCVSDGGYGDYSGAIYAPPAEYPAAVYAPAPVYVPPPQQTVVYAPRQTLGQFLNDYQANHRRAIGY
jgi:hypothetical protein